MLAGGLIISRTFVQVRTAPKHRSTHISNYQSSVGMSFASKGLGYHAPLFYYYRYLLVTNYLAIKLHRYLQLQHLQTLPCWKPVVISVCSSFGFDTITYRKELRLIPYTCGSSRLFSGTVAREWSAFGKWNLVRKHLYSVLKFIVTCYYGT